MKKLSELLREAAADPKIEQTDGAYYREDCDTEGKLCLCAMGAAYYKATGELPEYLDVDFDYDDEGGPIENSGFDLQGLLWDYVDTFQLGYFEDIVNWNDIEGLTFEQIADKLEEQTS
jgi:hypothetical protein